MKTIFTLFASLIMSVAALAADIKSKSSLMISSADRSNIRVVIDGRSFEPNHNSIKIQNVDAGLHDVQVYRQRNNGIFNVVFGKRDEMVFSKTVAFKARTSVTISIDRFGRTTMNETRTQGWNGRNDSDYDEDEFDFDRDSRSGGYDTRDDRSYGYKDVMSDRQFSGVLNAIQKEWFDNNKAKSASQIISTSYFTTAQVKQLLQLFTFESNRLELAKQAYTKTVDQKNYFLINDVFSFDSSKDELARYIRSCH